MDITDRFCQLTSLMSQGDLLATDDFSYYESMSAVELMDPKLDSGQQLMSLPPVSERISNGSLPDPSTMPQQTLQHIVDKQIFHLSLWLQGQSFAHTVLSCVYYQLDPDSVQNPTLRVFLECTYKFGSVLHGLIHDVACLRDDDYSYTLLELPEWNVENEDVIARSIDALNIQSESLKSRFEFFKLLILLVSRVGKGNLSSEVLIDTVSNIQRELEKVKSGSFLTAQSTAFDTNYSLLKIPHFPPNKIYNVSQFTVEQCFASIENFLKSIENISKLRDINNLDHLLTQLDELPSFDILSRALIEKNIYVASSEGIKVFGKYPLRLMILKSMSRFCVNTPKIKDNEEFEQYAQRVEIVFKEQILLRLKNKTRRRRILGKYLSDFNILVAEAEYIEQHLNNGRKEIDQQMLFHWIFSRALEAMLEYLRLGFTLQLYTYEDLGMVMFYMDFLYGTLGNSKGYLLRFIGSKEGKKVKNKAGFKEIEAELQWFKGVQLLCRGLLRSYMLFKTLGKVTHNQQRERARFVKRFSVFESMAVPQRLEYDNYAGIHQEQNLEEEPMMAKCTECLTAARNAFTQLGDSCKSLVRVAVSNSLALSKAKRLGWQCRVNLSNREHSIFPTCEVIGKQEDTRQYL